MLKNKNIWILITTVFVITAVFVYLANAVTTSTVSGYLVLMDQKVSSLDYSALGVKSFESTIYLPSSNGEGIITSCSFIFPSGVNERSDITKDGKIDILDLNILVKSFGCKQENITCWEESITSEECYFTFSDRQFKDPTLDCYVNMSDLNLISSCFGQTTNPTSTTCDVTPCCRADVNKDGIVDIIDTAIVGGKLNTYADVFTNFRYLKKKDADLNDDGEVDISDVVIVALDYGQKANEQICKNKPLENLGGNKWRVIVSGRGLYYVGVSYRVIL